MFVRLRLSTARTANASLSPSSPTHTATSSQYYPVPVSRLSPREPRSRSHAARRIPRMDFFQSVMQQPPRTSSDLISSLIRLCYPPLPSVGVKQILFGTYSVTSGREAKTKMVLLAINGWKMPSNSYGFNGRDLSSVASLLIISS